MRQCREERPHPDIHLQRSVSQGLSTMMFPRGRRRHHSAEAGYSVRVSIKRCSLRCRNKESRSLNRRHYWYQHQCLSRPERPPLRPIHQAEGRDLHAPLERPAKRPTHHHHRAATSLSTQLTARHTTPESLLAHNKFPPGRKNSDWIRDVCLPPFPDPLPQRRNKKVCGPSYNENV